ncbi:hypothetical protein [Corynebacterium glutamicum]|uniref:hypothetical protein n=1 Tax=Corynebacterium glutamicum TaxID=1718 RepID=UPI00058A5C29|nr:hypothetical protein [Corynebacterium glutamicum]AJE67902.1 hypothetical protein SB89_10260 [Corynebacterium glutamicum]OKX96186.1 hypothetical protein AUP72_00445 [Corynebacterium glutamicum]TWS37442.1 hypothetical protein AKJ21_07450 [Corynebacterium glutamicum]
MLPKIKDVDVINAPHHGSKAQSSDELYTRMSKGSGIVLAPADEMQKYKHPNYDLLSAAMKTEHVVIRVGNSPTQHFGGVLQ